MADDQFEIFDTMEQGTPEWHAARCGIPTASEFKVLLRLGKGGGKSLTRESYLRIKAGETISGMAHIGFQSAAMKRGNEMEADAFNNYAFATNVEVKRVGFIRDGNKGGKFGCSPDGLIGTEGMVEIKTMNPDSLIPLLDGEEMPPDHIPQCQGNLFVAKRKWIDLAFYWPNHPIWRRRIERDEHHITQLREAIDVFNYEVRKTVNRIKAMGAIT